MRVRPLIFSSLALLLGGACFSADDTPATTDEASSTAGDGDGDASGDGDGDEPLPTTTTSNDGSEMCEPGDVCVDDTIAGWDGPVAVYVGPVGEPPPNCQGGVPETVAQVFTDLQTNMSGDTCGCECGPATSFECGPTTLESSANPNCAVPNGSWDIDPGECRDLGASLGNYSYRATPAPLLSAQCSANQVEPLQPAAHAEQVLACAVDDMAQSCGEGGVCMPPPDAPWDGRVCIVAEGDVQCPSGIYGVRNVYYLGVDDSRSCGSCACDAPPGATCSGKVNLLSNGCGLQGLKLGEVSTGECAGPHDNIEFAVFAADDYEGGCMPSGGGVEGDVVETGAVTFCCQ